MTNFREFIAGLFGAANSNNGQLARIEGLVVISSFLLLLMFILDSYRRRSRGPIFKYVLLILDTATFSMVTYTVGLMQSTPVKNELFQVWAVVLVILNEGMDYISAYGVEEKNNRRRREMRDIIQSFWVAYLNATHGTKLKYPLWLLWGLNISKILHRMVSYELASQSYGIGRNPRLVADYMMYEHELSDPHDVDPVQMTGYKYLVYGEDKQKVEASAPSYAMKLTIVREHHLITLDKVWQCKGRLLNPTGDPDRRLKDLCLSFALSKLLHRRFDDLYPLAESHHPKTRMLVFQGLLSREDDHERVFRVIEVELAFINDLFFTRYPIIFSKGFPIFNVILFFMVGASCCLAAAIVGNFQAPEGDTVRIEHGVNVDKVITFVVLLVVVIEDVWEIITYLSSDWAKVVMLCKYVQKPSWQNSVCIERALRFLCRRRVLKPWHRRMGQYSFLDSFDYTPLNVLYILTVGFVEKKMNGKIQSSPIKLPLAVKKAIVRSLRSNDGSLTNGVTSLQQNAVSSELSWACRLETNTHIILVWHIATSLCELKLLQRYDTKMILENSSSFAKCLNLLSSSFASMKNWCWPPPFPVDIEILNVDLRSHYVVATSLSRYCAYLVVFKPHLLPDRRHAPEFIFEKAIIEARDYFEGCKSQRTRYERMMTAGEEAKTIIEMGAKLGKKLIATIEDDSLRWKVLGEFWAEIMLYVSPSYNSDAHASSLTTGGEFVTHLWALLSHAGILEQPQDPQSI